jgi:hypothetical protein
MNTDKPIEEMIIEDHTEVRNLLNKYNSTTDHSEKLKWYKQFLYEICRHAIAEELVLYPMMREHMVNGKLHADADLEDHRRVKEDLAKLQHIDIKSSNFDFLLMNTWNALLLHMSKEEDELQLFASEIPLKLRIDAGKKFQNRKLIVPTRPHTMIPDSNPTIEALFGLLVAPVDKFLDLFTSFPDQKEVEKVTKVRDIQGSTSYSQVSRP